MGKRRPMGSLEEHVMEYLWMVRASATPAEVRSSVAPELAYTSVSTVLTRLWEKGRVSRTRRGRSFVYEAVASEAEHRAVVMASELEEAVDRHAVLSRFVDGLEPGDLGMLRALLRRRG